MPIVQADLHTHTIVSGHAYSTMQEMAAEAARRGLKILGITEHAPSIPGTCGKIYFTNMHVVPREMYGIRLMLGCEINILDTDGRIDLDDATIDRLDITIAGIHDICWRGGTIDENTAGMIRVMENPKIQMISHPADGTATLHLEELVKASRRTGTILEINNHSLSPNRTKRVLAEPNSLELLRLCKRYEVPAVLGSDAHISFQIADYDRIRPLLQATEFPDALILNYDADRLLATLKPLKGN